MATLQATPVKAVPLMQREAGYQAFVMLRVVFALSLIHI